MVPTMAKGMEDMTPLIKTTLIQFGEYIREAIAAFPDIVETIIGGPNETTGMPKGMALSALSGVGTLAPRTGGLNPYLGQVRGGTIPAGLQEVISNYYAKQNSGVPLDSSEDAHAKRVALQKIEDARVKRLQDLLKAKVSAQIRKDARAGVPQIAKTNLFGKKKAGQSQIMARNNLIRTIKRQKEILQQQRAKGTREGLLVNRVNNVRRYQQLLTNLLARYRF